MTRPVYLPGYVTWEHRLKHHDPLTDIFSLGMILASLACGMDFADPEILRSFVAHRRNLFSLSAGLHPGARTGDRPHDGDRPPPPRPGPAGAAA